MQASPNAEDAATAAAEDAATASVRAWIDAWGDEVARVDLETARHRFDDGVVAFGTRAYAVRGVDAVASEQWSKVWPTISGFRFRTEELIVDLSPDGLQAVAIVPWSSTGFGADGETFDRPGRATVVLRREHAHDVWRGTHTHFSLAAGVPGRSHGRPGETSAEP